MDKTYFDRESGNTTVSPFGIAVNQAGYKPYSSKLAVMAFECEKFAVVDENDGVIYEGKTEHFGFDNNSADEIYAGDFSALDTVGKYRITAEGKRSPVFEIGENVYDKVLDDTLRAFYFLRCGSGLDEAHAGVYKHGKCHNGKAVLWGDASVSADVSGGWHDAGDYGRYVTAGACAVGHLLYSLLLFPKLSGLYLNIPESGNGVPDILNECRYELEWIIKMQREDGGVYHKVTTAIHAPFVMPEEDNEQLYLFPVSSMAVADTAAICALGSRIYRADDIDFSDKLKLTAERSYRWLENNPEFIGFKNPEGCNTGGYGEWEDRSNRCWAAAEMYSLTGEEKYHKDFKMLLEENFSRTGLGYGDVGGLAALAYILLSEGYDAEVREELINAFKEEAKKLRKTADECGYGAAMAEEDYHWGSNMDLLKHGMIFIISDFLSGENKYAAYTQRIGDYLLGLNAMGISYVTGTGEYRCNYPHLRPAHADGIEECIPGMVSGGPNRFPCDPDAEILIPKGTPPMKCFADDVGCYSLNEITIYWNSPAVFVLAYLQYGMGADDK